MGIKRTLKSGAEDHGVKCAGCSRRETIRVKDLGADHRFNDRHEYLCLKCRRPGAKR